MVASSAFLAATPAQAQVIDLDVLGGGQPLDLSLLTLDLDLIETLDAALNPAASALINCVPSACITFVESLAAQRSTRNKSLQPHSHPRRCKPRSK
ncbi:MAG: hypothetical protein ACR2J1_11970 [Methyloceanibacter sp.]|uniref:hypothetical protein n=1 Tax=Methyloceanibacter sp. TaxID=1965321 RepID=UPI003D9AF321